MQVGVDVTCMHTNFGGCGFSGFGNIATLKNGQISLDYSPWSSKEELRGGVVGEKEDLPAIQDTDFNFEEDGQGTLRFYAKKNKDLEPQLDTLNNKSSTKEEAQPVAKSAAIEHLELALNTPSDEVKKSVKKEETAAAKSFPDDEDDEKARLREEEERAYNAYHQKNETIA